MGVAGVVFLFLDAERNAEPGKREFSIKVFNKFLLFTSDV
jgi:hypothetical protein